MLKSKIVIQGLMFIVLASIIGLAPIKKVQAQDKKPQAVETQKVQTQEKKSPAVETQSKSPLNNEDKEKIKTIRNQIKEKNKSLKAMFEASTFNETQAQTTFDEIQKLHSEVAQIQFKATVAHKKANPDWQPPTRKKNKKAKNNDANTQKN